MEPEFSFDSLLRLTRKQRQARRYRKRFQSRHEVWLELDSLLRLYEALGIPPDSRHMCSPVDESLPTCFWHSYSTLPPDLFEKRLQAFSDAGGSREVSRLLYRLDAMKWRERTVERLCRALFGTDWENESNIGKETIWQQNS